MEINYIKEFLILADVCNYGVASDMLFISQSALFNHIKILESEVDAPLFVRDGKRIILSDYGRIFIPYADQMVKSLEQYMLEIDTSKNYSRTLKIGTQYSITKLLKNFRVNNSECNIEIMDCYNCLDALDDHSCELAFVRDVNKKSDKYESIPFFRDTLNAAFYKNHPMARKKAVSLNDLRNEDFVMISQYQEKECYGISVCKKSGFIPNVVMTAPNGSEAAKLVSEGFGISLLLNGIMMTEKVPDLVLIDLVPKVHCDISLCWSKDTVLSHDAHQFVDYIRRL